MTKSSFIKINNKGYKDVVVSFSSVGVPMGKFNTSNTLRDIQANIIFINCPQNNWYLGEIPGLGSNYLEVVRALDNIVKTLLAPEGKVLYYGGSMGGYGALLYGCLNNADYVVATGVEFNLHKENGLFFNLSRDKSVLVHAPDIREIVKYSNTKIKLLFGEFSLEDLREVGYISDLTNVTTIGLVNCGHSVPIILNNFIGISNLLTEIVQKGYSKSLKVLEGNLIKYSAIVETITKKQGIPLIKELEMQLENTTIDIFTKSYLYYFLARVNFTNGNLELSSKYANLCIYLNGNHYLCLQLFSKTYKDTDNKEMSIIMQERAIQILLYLNSDSIVYQKLVLADLYSYFNEKEKSIMLLEAIESQITKNTNMYNYYLKILNRLMNNKEEMNV